jgi:hypothetical protein|tara:strand:+ start:29 stop:424 length:396 start_codon:yes stop_codon:yes gene_type:complete
MSTLKADAITAVTTNGDVSISGNGSGGLNMLSGASATPFNAGTKASGTFTPNEADANFQHVINGGAHTLAPPTNNCCIIVQYTNNASAGAITVSGFTKVDGDTATTTNGDDSFYFITKLNGFSLLTVKALQ